MNIAIVCEGFNRRSVFVQPWHRIYAISRRLAAKKGLSVLVISDKTPNFSELEEIDGITIARIKRSRLTGILEKKAFVRVLTENKAEIIVWCGAPSSAIHLNSHLNQLKKVGIPIVWEIDMDIQNLRNLTRLSFRELLGPEHSLLLLKLLAMICLKFITKRIANSSLVSQIVVPSNSIANSLRKIGVNSNKICVIPSTIEKKDFGLSESREKNMLRSERGIGRADFVVTYFGSPCTMRGTDTLVLSMRRILSFKKNVKLILLSRRETRSVLSVVDNGSNDPGGQHCINEEEYLKKLIKRMGVENNVQVIAGILSSPELRNYLLMSDVIALPFKYVFSEPPLSLLQAMSLGKAIVTTNLGTLSEIVGSDRGILIEPSNEKALAGAILYLANHPEVSANIGENAHRFVAGLYDWEQVALHFEELLEVEHARYETGLNA